MAHVVGPDSLAAYSAEKMLWRTNRLVIDDLRVRAVDDLFVYCEGFVPPGADRRFHLKREDGSPVIEDGDDWRY